MTKEKRRFEFRNLVALILMRIGNPGTKPFHLWEGVQGWEPASGVQGSKKGAESRGLPWEGPKAASGPYSGRLGFLRTGGR